VASAWRESTARRCTPNVEGFRGYVPSLQVIRIGYLIPGQRSPLLGLKRWQSYVRRIGFGFATELEPHDRLGAREGSNEQLRGAASAASGGNDGAHSRAPRAHHVAGGKTPGGAGGKATGAGARGEGTLALAPRATGRSGARHAPRSGARAHPGDDEGRPDVALGRHRHGPPPQPGNGGGPPGVGGVSSSTTGRPGSSAISLLFGTGYGPA
jgi:hypothetical protein